MNNNNRNNSYRCRPVCSVPSLANQPKTYGTSSIVVDYSQHPVKYDIPFEDIVQAFIDCIKNKKTSADCILFFPVYPQELVRIWEEVRRGIYLPGKSKKFVVKWPVAREIFAASFADRIIHHWWAARVNPLYEELFNSQGNVTMNCRKGYGSLKAVSKVREIVDAHPDWYVGKFDFEGYFMSMDKMLLWQSISRFLHLNYTGNDLVVLLYITRVLVLHSPQKNCIRRSPSHYWDNIPPKKTLSCQPEGKGCAIGNLPSQLNANFLGAFLDYYITVEKGVKDYVRFVDDFVVFLPTGKEVASMVPGIEYYTATRMLITLHPRKRFIQPVRQGFLFVGAYIHPGRTYISNRTRGRMMEKIHHYNKIAEEEKCKDHLEKFVQSMNSYLGMMVHYKTYNIRHGVMMALHKNWWKYIMFDGHLNKIIIRKQYKPLVVLKNKIKKREYRKMLTPELEP